MKKLVSLLLAVALLVSVFSTLAVAEEKVTVSLLTTRNSTATNDIEDVWFFKYLAQKMNVDFELEQTLETDQRISLMFASDSVPDLVWGIGLSNNDVMVYGVQEGMLLNWKDLITQAYGTAFDLKDNQLVLPCYTEEAKEFITFYNTLYNEGLISPDYFTLDQTAARGLMASGVCGVLGDSTLTAIGDAWPSWVALSPLTSDVNDMAVAAFNPGYSVGQLYASAYTEHPEVLARIVDYMYSDEGALYYFYGPMKGTEETLGMVDGWYYDENNRITTDKVVNGEFTDISEYAYQYIKSYSSAPGRFDHYSQTAAAMAGIEFPGKEMTIVDKLTGAEIPSLIMDVYTDDNNDGHWRITQSEAMIDHLTAVRLPDVYLTAEQNQRVADLSTVINDYVTAESAKFIVGTRPLSELDAYFEELKSLGIEEYIAIYQEAYAPFLETLQ